QSVVIESINRHRQCCAIRRLAIRALNDQVTSCSVGGVGRDGPLNFYEGIRGWRWPLRVEADLAPIICGPALGAVGTITKGVLQFDWSCQRQVLEKLDVVLRPDGWVRRQCTAPGARV